MGYTHYFKSKSNHTKKSWKQFTLECAKLIKNATNNIELADGWGKGHPTVDIERVCFNGRLDTGHETFEILNGKNGDTCKTGRKEYDLIVVACLLSANRNLGLTFESDGIDSEITECDDLILAIDYYNEVVEPEVDQHLIELLFALDGEDQARRPKLLQGNPGLLGEATTRSSSSSSSWRMSRSASCGGG